jgi:hypothetical protein
MMLVFLNIFQNLTACYAFGLGDVSFNSVLTLVISRICRLNLLNMLIVIGICARVCWNECRYVQASSLYILCNFFKKRRKRMNNPNKKKNSVFLRRKVAYGSAQDV